MRNQRAVAAALALLAAAGASTDAAFAANVTIAFPGLSGYSTPIPVDSWSINATNTSTTGGAGTSSFGNLNFVAPESSVSPAEWQKLALGATTPTALLQVVTPSTGKLASDWTFTTVKFSSIRSAIGSTGESINEVGITYGKVQYRVYAADGVTVVQQMCYDTVAKASC